MGLAWQQGPLAPRAVGHFLVPEPLPQRLLYAEPLRRRMRVRFGGEWIADSEDVLLLHEPGHYPVAFFPLADVRSGVLVAEDRTTQHRELGDTAWFTVTAGDRSAARAICLAVTDIEATHRELTGRGVQVSAIRHKSPTEDGTGGWQPGADAKRRDYASFADFADPDGNTWVLQEIGYRAPAPSACPS